METMEVEPKTEPTHELSEGQESAFSKASRTKKYIASFAIYYCNFGDAIAYTYLGPTIVDFSKKFQTSVAHVSTAFSVMTGAYLAGALLAGVVSSLVNRQSVAITGLIIGSTALFLFPHISSIGAFFALAAMLGLFVGGYDTIQVAWIIDIWRHEAPPYILAQHFCYSLGTIVPPLVLSPYLRDTSGSNTTIANNSTENIETETTAQLWIPFTVAGAILSFGIVLQIFFYLVFFNDIKNHRNHRKSIELAPLARDPLLNCGKFKFEFPAKEKIILVALSCTCIAFYQSSEVTTVQFLPTFAQFSQVGFSESQAADLLFGLTIAFCICRAIGILVVLKVPPHFILAGNFSLLIVANVLFLFAGDSKTLMWVASCLMGCAMSTTYPAYWAYIEKYLFLTDGVVAIIVTCAGAVSAIYPVIVGGAVESNPRVLIYVNLFSLSIFGTAFCITFWFTHLKDKKDI